MSSDIPRNPRGGQDPPAVRHLRLAHPAPPRPPDGPRTRGGLRTPHQNEVFSQEEQARLRAALKNARFKLGSVACLADAMRVPLSALRDAANGRTRFSAAVAVKLARALGVPLESLLRAPAAVDVCPTCGARRTP